MSDLQKQIDELTAANVQLKKQLDNANAANTQMQQGLQYLQTEKAVLSQTVGEILNGNIQTRTQLSILETSGKKMADESAAKQKQIDDLTAKLTVANAVVERATNLEAPKDKKAV